MIDPARGYWIAVHDRGELVSRFHATYGALLASVAAAGACRAQSDLIEVIERRADGRTTRHGLGTLDAWCCERRHERDAERGHSEGRRTAQARGR